MSRSTLAFGLALACLAPTATAVAGADALTIEATPLLGGHVRVGAWLAIEVHLTNDGPAVTGELQLAGGNPALTRFSTPVDLPTGSDKTYVVYSPPPANVIGAAVTVNLVDSGKTLATVKPKYTNHDGSQLIVGIVAERPEGIVRGLHLLPNQNQLAPVVTSLTPADLPERVEALGTLDALIWQDVDSAHLTTAQLSTLQGWIAAGGRLVIVSGTAGPRSLTAFPDALLPFRPETTTDVPASSLVSILGALPTSVGTMPALSGTLQGGRALATVADRVVAAERPHGSGMVTILGIDPTVDWIATTETADALWRRLVPARSTAGLAFADDSMMVQAVSQLPALALPPITGLIALLGAYILLIGPINYLVLRRLDRREWAWITMPVMIVLFAVGAYAIGATLRGNDLIVNEVAIARGAPDATEGTAQVYIGVFSPTRGTYQVSIPGGALLSTPISGDVFGTGTSRLDIVQGDTSRVRDLEVGFGSLRTIRAQAAVTVPRIATDLRLDGGHIKGTVTNRSEIRLERPAVVLGSTVDVLDDLEPGESAEVDALIKSDPFGMQLSDRIVGQIFFGDGDLGSDAGDQYIRHTMVDQLSYDPNFGTMSALPTEGPVVLAWGSASLLPVEIDGQTARHLGNVLYYIPTGYSVSGPTTFRADLIRSTVVGSDAAFFSQDPFSINFGRGSATIAYRPAGFEGTLDPTELGIALSFGGDALVGTNSNQIEPLPSIPPPCEAEDPSCQRNFDGLPEVELFDLTTQSWVRLPHLAQGPRYSVVEPDRYIDPTSATVLIRYVNDINDGVGFSADISISGDVHD